MCNVCAWQNMVIDGKLFMYSRLKVRVKVAAQTFNASFCFDAINLVLLFCCMELYGWTGKISLIGFNLLQRYRNKLRDYDVFIVNASA